MPRIAVGWVSRPHGVRGELRIKLQNEQSQSLRAGIRVYLIDNNKREKSFEIETARAVTDGILLRCAGVDDRDQAQALVKATVYIDSDILPKSASDEWYAFELVGCNVISDSGREYGCVVDLVDNGAHALLRIHLDKREWLLPFVDAYILRVDQEQRCIYVADYAEQLLELATPIASVSAPSIT